MDTQTHVAASMLETYGSFPVSHTFSNNDTVPDMLDSDLPAYGAAFDPDPSAKRHAACDECRKRKLKCSGEPTGCARCIKQNLTCHYSTQKQMGRPRKRQKMEDSAHHRINEVVRPKTMSIAAIDPTLSSDMIERTNFENVCNGPITQAIKRNNRPPPSKSFNASASTSSTSPLDVPRTPPDNDFLNMSYPTDIALWPDFSDMTSLPVPMQDSHEKGYPIGTGSQGSHTDPDANPSYLQDLPTSPECPCLPNLYLTLSTLSSLSAFPVSNHTIATLEAAHRTARSVIYCPICPQKFQSGSQNVMLSSTLMTVLVDQWQRVIRSSGPDLRRGFSSSPGDEIPLSPRADLEWRTFAYNMTRAHVFGDRPIPSPPSTPNTALDHPSLFPTYPDSNPLLPTRSTVSSPIGTKLDSRSLPLLSLAQAMERRQRQWHEMDSPSSEFPTPLSHDLVKGHAAGMTFEDMQRYDSEVKEHLCLQLVRHAKMCIRSLNKEVPVI